MPWAGRSTRARATVSLSVPITRRESGHRRSGPSLRQPDVGRKVKSPLRGVVLCPGRGDRRARRYPGATPQPAQQTPALAESDTTYQSTTRRGPRARVRATPKSETHGGTAPKSVDSARPGADRDDYGRTMTGSRVRRICGALLLLVIVVGLGGAPRARAADPPTVVPLLDNVLARPATTGTQTQAAAGLPAPSVHHVWVAPGAKVDTACGTQAGDDAAFYCATDDTIYIGQTFAAAVRDGVANGLPGQRAGFGHAAGDFAVAFVVAHEYGHNVQNEDGVFLGGPRALPTELNADCLAGTWAHWDKTRAGCNRGTSRKRSTRQWRSETSTSSTPSITAHRWSAATPCSPASGVGLRSPATSTCFGERDPAELARGGRRGQPPLRPQRRKPDAGELQRVAEQQDRGSQRGAKRALKRYRRSIWNQRSATRRSRASARSSAFAGARSQRPKVAKLSENSSKPASPSRRADSTTRNSVSPLGVSRSRRMKASDAAARPKQGTICRKPRTAPSPSRASTTRASGGGCSSSSRSCAIENPRSGMPARQPSLTVSSRASVAEARSATCDSSARYPCRATRRTALRSVLLAGERRSIGPVATSASSPM